MSVALGVVQMAMSDVLEDNVAKAIELVRDAARSRARRWCCCRSCSRATTGRRRSASGSSSARTRVDGHPFIGRFQALARQLGVVLPLSFFEKAGHAHYNSLVMIDATGESLGLYRKSHIPDGPGYMEKYYFTPGDTGFKAFATRSGTLGAAICWDQWYPETARAMALQGAEVLLYPTAIGTEPEAAGPMDTSRMWRRVMLGHAVANACYLGAANRVGREVVEGSEQTFLRHQLHLRLRRRDSRRGGSDRGDGPGGAAESRRSARVPRGYGILQGPPARPVWAVADEGREDAPLIQLPIADDHEGAKARASSGVRRLRAIAVGLEGAVRCPGRQCLDHRLGREILPWIDEPVLLEVVLPIVELPVASLAAPAARCACRARRSRRAPAPESGRRSGWWTGGAR